MTLENLLKIGQLIAHETDTTEIGQLLGAARRNLADAGVTAISAETRFDAAYKAIMQAALAALMANGFRPSTNRPGHHMTVLQTLPKTISLSSKRMVVLDVLRKKRNLSDYTGDYVDDTSVESCIAEARRLVSDVIDWLEQNRPALVSQDLDQTR